MAFDAHSLTNRAPLEMKTVCEACSKACQSTHQQPHAPTLAFYQFLGSNFRWICRAGFDESFATAEPVLTSSCWCAKCQIETATAVTTKDVVKSDSMLSLQ